MVHISLNFQASGNYGSDGIGSPVIPWLPTSHGDSGYFGGGGGASGWSDSAWHYSVGGNGGGADGRYGSPLGTLSNATANTGGGGAR